MGVLFFRQKISLELTLIQKMNSISGIQGDIQQLGGYSDVTL